MGMRIKVAISVNRGASGFGAEGGLKSNAASSFCTRSLGFLVLIKDQTRGQRHCLSVQMTAWQRRAWAYCYHGTGVAQILIFLLDQDRCFPRSPGTVTNDWQRSVSGLKVACVTQHDVIGPRTET